MTDTAPRKMTIDIYSDVMCPWCIIGYGQLQKALAELEGEIEAEIRWRPFELNPDMPAEGEEQAAHIARKYGRTAEQTQALRSQMRSLAEQAGVSLDYEGEEEAPPAMMWNTHKAHMLLLWAGRVLGSEKQTELKLSLFRAHFNERRNISDKTVLLDIAEELGIKRYWADREALSHQDIHFAVRHEQQQGFDLNITGVPAMIVEGKMIIPGAQAPEVYVNALRRVAEKFPAN